ncbi:MAG TPA: hypothetical protein VM260_16450, partial [Pirellula sp.]|nr:hypothetical protein [Pirellula sp.]
MASSNIGTFVLYDIATGRNLAAIQCVLDPKVTLATDSGKANVDTGASGKPNTSSAAAATAATAVDVKSAPKNTVAYNFKGPDGRLTINRFIISEKQAQFGIPITNLCYECPIIVNLYPATAAGQIVTPKRRLNQISVVQPLQTWVCTYDSSNKNAVLTLETSGSDSKSIESAAVAAAKQGKQHVTPDGFYFAVEITLMDYPDAMKMTNAAWTVHPPFVIVERPVPTPSITDELKPFLWHSTDPNPAPKPYVAAKPKSQKARGARGGSSDPNLWEEIPREMSTRNLEICMDVKELASSGGTWDASLESGDDTLELDTVSKGIKRSNRDMEEGDGEFESYDSDGSANEKKRKT